MYVQKQRLVHDSMGTCGKCPHREFPEEMTSAAYGKEADVIKQASGSGKVVKQ